MTETDIARLTRERDEARERAAGLSRELLAAMQARDSYRASADLRVGMRREFEALLGCGDTMGDEAFERGLIRLRALLATEARAARLAKALAPFADPERYNTAEEECRENKAMRWCAVHSFRWPCPVGPARAAIAAEEEK